MNIELTFNCRLIFSGPCYCYYYYFFLSTTSFLHTSLSFKNNQAHLTFQGPLVRHGLALSIAYTTAENQAPTYTEKKLQCSSDGKSSDRSFSKKSNSDSPFLSNPNKCSKRTFYLISQESHLGATCSQFLNFFILFLLKCPIWKWIETLLTENAPFVDKAGFHCAVLHLP